MILPKTSLAEAQVVAERVRTEVAAVDVGARDLRVTVSVGVASFPESARDTDGVLGAADAALLRAKARGRNRVCLFSEDKTAAVTALEGDLVALGRQFAERLGLSDGETAGLITALAVYESGGRVSDEVQTILGETVVEAGPVADEVRQNAFDALLYGSERWDGGGYPEGRRGVVDPPRGARFRRLPRLPRGQRDRLRPPAVRGLPRVRPAHGPALHQHGAHRGARGGVAPSGPLGPLRARRRSAPEGAADRRRRGPIDTGSPLAFGPSALR